MLMILKLNYYNELVSFLCVINISSDFKKNLFQGKVATEKMTATEYNMWNTENNAEEIKL